MNPSPLHSSNFPLQTSPSGRYRPYPEYKDSGVERLGMVPEHWDMTPLKYGLRLLTEKSEKRRNSVALENIESWTGRFLSSESEYEGEGITFEIGDILFGKLRPYLAKAYRAEFEGEAVGDFHVLRPVQGIDGGYAQYLILNREFIADVDGSTYGSKMPRASWEFVGAMKITAPPLPEQIQIALFLDHETAKIDRLIAKQRELIALLNEKRQAVISHAVTKGLNPDAPMKPTGIDWMPEVPAHWQTIHLGSKIKLINGYPFDSKLFSNDGTGHPLIRIRDIFRKDTVVTYDGEFVEEAAVQAGDILVGMDGDFNVARWKGAIALLNQRVCCRRRVSCFSPRFSAEVDKRPDFFDYREASFFVRHKEASFSGAAD